MRTKHLLTAMVLPALFAACTNDELEVVSNNSAEASRAVVEDVVLDFSRGVDSRLAYGEEGYTWEANDQIGACLMDELTKDENGKYLYLDQTKKWSEWFSLVNYIQTNYKFTRDAEGNWETEAKLCEGNYFFAYPYNANRGLRLPYTFSCADQILDNTNASALKKAFAENNSFVGYGKIAANSNEGESVAVPMVPVFGATGFTLLNTGTNTYTIEKIVLSGKEVSSYAVVKPAGIFDVAKHTGEVVDNNYKKTEALQGVLAYTKNGRIDVTLEAGNTIGKQESVDVIVMSGAFDIDVNDDEDAILEIHTNKGLIRGINLNVKQQANNGVLGSNAVVNVLTDKALPALGAGDKIAITFDDTSLDVPAKMHIYSTDELARFIKWNKNVNDVVLSTTLMNDVNITKEMCENLEASKIKKITVWGNANKYGVTIDADAPANVMDLFEFKNMRTIIVKGEQTITEKEITVPVFVIEGATLNVSKNIENTVNNEGTVNVKANINIKNLNNKGTVVADKNLTTTLENIGTVTNNATLNVSGHNHGTITNNGTLSGAIENAAALTAACAEHDVKHPAGTIENYGKVNGILNNARVNMKSATAEYDNSVSTSEGKIENSIMSKYVNKAISEQIIAIVDAEETKASELVAVVKGSGASELYLSGKLVLDPKTDKDGNLVDIDVIGQEATLTVYAEGLTISGEGKIRFCQNKNREEFAKFDVSKGTTIVETDASVVVGDLDATIENNNGAMLKIQKGAKFYYYGEKSGEGYTNYGSLIEK